jgi:hypothetical protein
MHLTYSVSQSVLDTLVSVTELSTDSISEHLAFLRTQLMQFEITRKFLGGKELGKYSHTYVPSE